MATKPLFEDTALVPQSPAKIAPKTPMDLLQLAIEREGSIDVIERLAKLQMEMIDRDAKNAYIQAFEKFKDTVPPILKDSAIVVNEQVRGKYAKLDKICNTLIPCLLKVGITHRWRSRTSDDGKMIFVTCFLRHRNGYEEEGSTLGAAPDGSGSKNAVQASGSTMAYLERYTLVASCGLAIKDQDNVDGPTTDLTEKQQADLQDYIDALRQAPDLPQLKSVFADAYKFAKTIGDQQKAQMARVYEEQKKRVAQ
jgi:hypothetical protein